MRRLSLGILVMLIGLAAGVPPVLARQLALVVGVARYDHLDALKNPGRDAAAIADRLRDQGFEVIEAFDADRFALERARRRFLAEARGADLALFYFAGHGVQLFDRNVLLVRDAAPTAAASIEELGLDLNQLMADLRAAGPVRTAFLIDACRDNPLGFDETVALLRRLEPAVAVQGSGRGVRAAPQGRSRGLSNVALPTRATGAGETLAFFAAQPGNVSFDGDGRHSFFVEGLLEAIAKPNRPLTEALRSTSAFVRTVTQGRQVPQLVSDWTGDVVLGRAEAVKVRYLNTSRSQGDKPLSELEARMVGEAARAYPALAGTFVVQASQSFTDVHLAAVDAEREKAKAIGSVNGFAIDYDIDRDGRLETIGVYFRQTAVVVEIIDEGISLIDAPCFENDAERVEAVEIALRDINGDRRPEIFLHYQTGAGEWGNVCILEYVGNPDLASSRRGARATGHASKSLFRTLLRHEGAWTVRIGADNSIETCAGSNCHTRSAYTFDGTHFRMTLDQSDPPSAGKAKPFRDQEEHERNQKDAGAAKPAAVPASPTAAAGISPSGDLSGAIARYVADVYLPSGASGGASHLNYEPHVLYYGKTLTAAAVLADKLRYVTRWPRRTYRLDPQTVRVTSGPAGLADVTFEYVFEVSDGKRTSAGRGRTRLTLRPTGASFSIAREDGEVISRQ